MNSCPVCAAEIEEAFGLIECPSCQHVLFVDLDGSLKLQTNSENGEGEVSTPKQSFAEELIPEGSSESASGVIEEAVVSWDQPIVREEPIKEKTSTQNKVLQEIQEFTNSQKSNLQQGSLFYDVTIYNLDTQDLRDEVQEILQESKFNVDLKKINFKLPQLTIKDLNAVKASVLVTRLKHLPIDIEWTQNSILNGEKS